MPQPHHHHFPAGLACSAGPSSASPAAAAAASAGAASASAASGGGMRALSSAAAPVAVVREGGFRRISSIVKTVVAEEGVRGLWRGATPGMIRAAVLTASQCATYDAAKRRLAALTQLPDDSLALQTGCALLTGLASTTATQPVDVIKTQMFVTGKRAAAAAAGGNPQAAAAPPLSMTATARAIFDSHGARGFLRGWTANYARLGPMTVLIFTTTEFLRRQLGMSSL